MKITAEFNSTQELISFIGAFGNKTTRIIEAGQIIAPLVETKETVKLKDVTKLDKPEKISVTGVKGEQVLEDAPKEETITPKEAETPKEEVKVTKEMIRERLGAIMKAGKQKEAKELLASHGASKLPELKEEEYAAVYKEAEELI